MTPDPGGPSTPAPKSERAIKKRASQACHHCRTRKVKCDVAKSGAPCHNCSSDGIECVILESKRSRKYRLQKRQLNHLVSLPSITQAQPKTTSDPSTDSLNRQSSVSNNVEPSQAGHSRSSDDTRRAPSLIPFHFPSPSPITPAAGLGVHSQTRTHSNVSAKASFVDLPSYIGPSRPDIRQDDVEFLARRGALNLPSNELRDQLLLSFVLYVYPYMPIVDLEEFVKAIDGKDGAPQISLIVFQAIMFAGAAYVELPYLQEAGYENRRAARGDFYQKIKLLYDFDWDVDRICLIQSLLLMNYWYVSENDQKDPWHWLGICISLATSIGLNQPITYANKDARVSRLWRRIWWSCVMRDRIISLSMRRPMRINYEDIKLPFLTRDDFEIRPISTSIPPLRECSFLTDGYTRTMLADMGIAKSRLLVSIGHIIKTFYHLRGFGGSTAESTMLYTPKRADINGKQFLDMQHELDQWYRNLPVSCWLVTSSGNADPDRSTADILLVHRSVLRMLFLMASEALNRPQSLAKSHTASERISTSKVKEAADKIADMIQSLQERDLVRHLPPLSVSFLLLALASFLVEIKTKGQSVEGLPGQRFHQCIRALLRLREIWPIADSACFLIGQMITKNRVGGISTPGIQPTPMESSGPPSKVWQTPEIPREILATPTYSQPGGTPNAFAPTNPEPHTLGADHPEMPSTTTPGFVIPYDWSEADFDGEYGVVADAQALNMDLAMAESDVLGVFENGFLDFEPSPHDQDAISYYPHAPSMLPEGWSPAAQNPFNGVFRGPQPV